MIYIPSVTLLNHFHHIDLISDIRRASGNIFGSEDTMFLVASYDRSAETVWLVVRFRVGGEDTYYINRRDGLRVYMDIIVDRSVWMHQFSCFASDGAWTPRLAVEPSFADLLPLWEDLSTETQTRFIQRYQSERRRRSI